MFELAVALVLIVINGIFSLSELAIVSARKIRLKTMAAEGRRGAAAALALAEHPGRFLSTVQIGITLVGVLAGAFSGAALGHRLSQELRAQGVAGSAADWIGYGGVVGFITYLSVVIGELLPKSIALRHAEAIACRMAAPMALLSALGAPVVWLLDASTRLVLLLIGQSNELQAGVTDEEIRTLIAEAHSAGSIEADEQQMIAGVLRLGDRAARALMTPRTEVDWLDLSEPDDVLRQKLVETTHARLPVSRGDMDDMIGVLLIRELLGPALRGEPLDLEAHVRPAPVVPDSIDALDALNVLREAETPMALVHDEYGHFEGVVTPADILDAIAGAFRSDEGHDEPEAVKREDGSWLLAGWMPVDEMAELLHVTLPENRSFDTVAGLVLDGLIRFPTLGETVDKLGWRFEVVDLDGRRVDKLLASKLPVESE
ncbi:hemolysin family protein [Methylocystis sp.]|uniref:hemolysin family protein n=1 Tax=Methylocystis sp. TaxID=1911079 RepID=UPI0025EDA293|nr:hemolysin family protein [Methylocystis sp.]